MEKLNTLTFEINNIILYYIIAAADGKFKIEINIDCYGIEVNISK